MEWYTENGQPKLKTQHSPISDLIGGLLAIIYFAAGVIVFLAAAKYLFE